MKTDNPFACRMVILAALLFVAGLPNIRASSNTWTSIGPDGGEINALAIDPQTPRTIYAGTSGGVFKSTDGGESWKGLSLTSPGSGVSALAIHPLNPGTLFAGTWERGVFKGADAGSTWNAVNSGLTTLNIRSLVIDRKASNRLYAGTNGRGMFATTFVPHLVVSELQFDRASVLTGGSFSANISGPSLTTRTFFDVLFASPGSNGADVSLNWQQGVAAEHRVPAGTPSGVWTINGIRAHEAEVDHIGSFFPMLGTITVQP